MYFHTHTATHITHISELAKAGSLELQQRIQDATSDRESTLEQAQKMADQLEGAEREKGDLQEALVAAQNQVEELQDQLDELSRRWGAELYNYSRQGRAHGN